MLGIEMAVENVEPIPDRQLASRQACTGLAKAIPGRLRQPRA